MYMCCTITNTLGIQVTDKMEIQTQIEIQIQSRIQVQIFDKFRFSRQQCHQAGTMKGDHC